MNSMTAAIRSPDSRGSRSTRKPAAGPANSKVTSIARARRAKTGPVLPNYSAADEQAMARQSASVLKVMPDRQSQPMWLRSILRVQRASSAAVVLLLGGALTLYGLTVYSEQRWNQEYQKLEALRRGEQQLSAASEVLKHQLAKEAQNPETGLAPQKPADTIFLSPIPQVDRPLRHQHQTPRPLSRMEAVWKRRWAIEAVSRPRGGEGRCRRVKNVLLAV